MLSNLLSLPPEQLQCSMLPYYIMIYLLIVTNIFITYITANNQFAPLWKIQNMYFNIYCFCYSITLFDYNNNIYNL